ncbi:MAG: tetratricopeptide repeat protein [Fimbriimonadales bacterium]|nr:tetratricopeptide repeat protein [Fimbriimonadales bacterium]
MREKRSSGVFAVSWRGQSPAELLISVGEWLEGQHEFEAAVRYYAAAANLEQDNALAYFRLGKLQLRRRNFHEAAKFLEKATVLTPDHAPTWYLLAQAYYELGDCSRAEEAATKAQQNDPNHSGAFLIRLRCARLRGDAEAVKTLLSDVPKGLASAKEVHQVASEFGISLSREQRMEGGNQNEPSSNA